MVGVNFFLNSLLPLVLISRNIFLVIFFFALIIKWYVTFDFYDQLKIPVLEFRMHPQKLKWQKKIKSWMVFIFSNLGVFRYYSFSVDVTKYIIPN